LVKKINLSLYSLAKTNLNEEEKKKVWEGLVEHTKNISDKSEEVLNKLDNIRFSESDLILQEERNELLQKFDNLLSLLREEKSTILRQMETKVVPITPLRSKVVKRGYCYFCDINIASGFPYKLAKEEQTVLAIEVLEGAEFCSQECLLGYCKEYKNREKLRVEEKKKNEEKIAEDTRVLTEAQTRVARLQGKINELERKEQEMELLRKEGIDAAEEKKPSSWQRFWQKVGLAKKTSLPLTRESLKREKITYQMKLAVAEKEVQKAIITLSIDRQVEQERQKLEKKLLQEKKKNEE
ncbi:6162_t:CDS:1, partial [Ambispora gerdemannii]